MALALSLASGLLKFGGPVLAYDAWVISNHSQSHLSLRSHHSLACGKVPIDMLAIDIAPSPYPWENYFLMRGQYLLHFNPPLPFISLASFKSLGFC